MSFCPKCKLTHQCICSAIPKLNSQLALSLLTHDNELQRSTNTGRWLLDALPDCRRYQWKRNAERPEWISKLNHSSNVPLLLFPSPGSIPLDVALKEVRSGQCSPHFIVIDATWQEAKKIERKSPWLDHVKRVSFTPSQASNYQLRRNQKTENLCTLEVVIELLVRIKEEENSKQLNHFFQFMMKSYLADKSGHSLK